MNNNVFFTAQGVGFTQAKRQILYDIDLQLPITGLIALIGANGAGKSTLLKLISRQLKPSKGTLSFNGADCLNKASIDTAYMPESGALYDELSVYEQLCFVCELKLGQVDLQEVDRLIEKLSLQTVINHRTAWLSLGYQQRVRLAQALLGSPDVLLLDEPMNGMDPDLQQFFKQLLVNMKEHMLIVMSTHMIHDAEEISDQAVFMNSGTIKHIQNDLSGSSLLELYQSVSQQSELQTEAPGLPNQQLEVRS